jgi:hypothetical protein
MATKTSTTSGNWSVGGTWVGGVKPADGDDVVIAAGHSVLMDDNTSYMTGLLSVTIQGHATTPAMLYFKNGTNGILKLRTGGYQILGTTGTLKGRLLANANGVWGDSTPLSNSNRALIIVSNTSYINGTYLDISLHCARPTRTYVHTYGTKYEFIASSGTVNTTNNTIDLGVTPPANGTTIQIMSPSGILPSGAEAEFKYFVNSVSGNTFKLSSGNSATTVIPLTHPGSGRCIVYTGYAAGSTTVNVLEDVTTDSCWGTASGWNLTNLCNSFAMDAARDNQVQRITNITPSSITLDVAVNSTQHAGARLYLLSRNVYIRNEGATGSTQTIVSYPGSTPAYSGDFHCLIMNESSLNGRAIVAGYPITSPATCVSNLYYGFYGSAVGYWLPIYGNYIYVYYGAAMYGRGMIFNGIGDSNNSTITWHNDIMIGSGEFRNNSYAIQLVYGFDVSEQADFKGSYTAAKDAFFGTINCELKNLAYAVMNTDCIINNDVRDITGNALWYSAATLYDSRLYRNNSSDIGGPGHNTGYRVSLLSATPMSWSTESTQSDPMAMYHAFYDVNGEKGQMRIWTAGGNTLTEAAPATPPVTLPYAYKHSCISTYGNYHYSDIPILVEGGKLLRIKIYEKCNVNPSTFTIGPKFQLVRKSGSFDSSANILVEKTAQADGGNDTNWHTIILDYRSPYDEQIILRVLGKATSAYFHWMYELQNNAVAVLQLRGV